MSSRRWNVQAKANRGRLSNAQIWQMLRTLLEDRFQPRAHLETRDLPVYELTVGRRGSKLQAPDGDKTHPEIRTGDGFIEFTQTTVATFASQLSYAVARPVIDKTGIPGEFSFNLKWTPAPNEDGGSTAAGAPALELRWLLRLPRGIRRSLHGDRGATGASAPILREGLLTCW